MYSVWPAYFQGIVVYSSPEDVQAHAVIIGSP